MQLLGLLSGSVAAAAVTWWALSAYFRVSIAESIAYLTDDGRCQPLALPGISPHCWQDYAQFIGLHGLTIGPDDNQFISNYPPISRVVFRAFEALGSLLGTTPMLVLFLLVNLLGLLVPAIWASRRMPWSQRVMVVSLLGVATLPTLATLDRGNNLGLIIPVLLVFMVALLSERYLLSVIMIVIVAQFKPQFLVLVFALMAVRQWRRTAQAIIASVAVLAASFLVFGTQALYQARLFVEYLVKFNGYQPLEAAYPPNISFGRFIQVAFATVTSVLPEPLRSNIMETWLAYRAPALLGIAFAVAAALLMIYLGNRVPVFLLASFALVIGACFPGITNAYYSAVVLCIGAYVVARDDIPGLTGRWATTMLAAITLSLSLAVIPYGFTGDLQSNGVIAMNLTPILATGAWMILIAAVLLRQIRMPARVVTP